MASLLEASVEKKKKKKEASVELLFLLKTMWHGCQYNLNKSPNRYLPPILITEIEDET